jgi:hypothetical protein
VQLAYHMVVVVAYSLDTFALAFDPVVVDQEVAVGLEAIVLIALVVVVVEVLPA